jgi:hypothetical protein
VGDGRRQQLAALALLAGCGRIAFDPIGDATGGDGAPARIEWMTPFLGGMGGDALVWSLSPDGSGGAFVAGSFQQSVTVAGQSYPSVNPPNDNGFVARLGSDGAPTWLVPLHAGGTCDMRANWYDAASDVVYAGGIGQGPMLSDGNPCDNNSLPQAPTLLGFAPSDGHNVSFAQLQASNQNGQLWNILMSGNTWLVDGIYDGDLVVNGVMLATAPACCDNGFVAQIGGAPVWQWALSSAGNIEVGGLDELAGDVCVSGRFQSGANLFGSNVTPVGDYDVWVARLGPDGTPRFVSTFGSTAYDGYAVVRATADGGCLLAMDAGGPVDFGGAVGVTQFAGGGSDVVIATLDAGGAATAATVIGGVGTEHVYGLAMLGGTPYVSIVFDGSLAIAGTTYTPQASDGAIIALAGTAPTRMIAVVTGAGDVQDGRLYSDGTSLFIAGQFTGDLALGSFTATAFAPSGYAAQLSP